MTAGRQPRVNEEINLLTDEDNNVLGFMKDARTFVPMPTVNTDPLTGKATGLSANGETNGIFQPSSRYLTFIPGQQFVTSGSAKDKSGQGADAAINGAYTDAAAWANTGYITTGAGANLSLAIANAKAQFNLASESVIFSAVVNKAAPAATEVIFGNADTGTVRGFYLTARSNGTVRIALTTDTGAQLIATDSAAILFDGTDHVLTVAIDGPSKAVYFYRDGALLNTFTSAFTGGTPSSGSGAGFVIGASQPGVSIALKTNGLHLLKFAGGLPVNLGLLAQKLAGAPRVHLTDADIQT